MVKLLNSKFSNDQIQNDIRKTVFELKNDEQFHCKLWQLENFELKNVRLQNNKL
jgi:hypothetical protein